MGQFVKEVSGFGMLVAALRQSNGFDDARRIVCDFLWKNNSILLDPEKIYYIKVDDPKKAFPEIIVNAGLITIRIAKNGDAQIDDAISVSVIP